MEMTKALGWATSSPRPLIRAPHIVNNDRTDVLKDLKMNTYGQLKPNSHGIVPALAIAARVAC
jgi:hypothetical protein